jgi:peroxiredoxin family protein
MFIDKDWQDWFNDLKTGKIKIPIDDEKEYNDMIIQNMNDHGVPMKKLTNEEKQEMQETLEKLKDLAKENNVKVLICDSLNGGLREV